ncbi:MULTISPECIES: hypothetical protein [Sphingomonas]|uniref:hypothetical protein n=1 Tax=Sphingomonas TaxID=13687 RepID=UPI001269F6A3|nr:MULTISPECIES: hypothetical protein [Sphingomonas]
MTDLRTTAARTRLSGVQADAEIAISCRSDGEINFVASTFQKDDQPAEMRTETVNGFGAQGIRYQMRADDKAAVQLVQAPLEYTNEVKLTSGTIQDTPGDGILPDTADEMAAAKRITLRLFLPNGEETFAWDQSSTEVGSVLAPCVASRAALRERKTEEQHAAEDQQRQAAERERQQRIEANKRDGRPNDDNTYAM